MGIARPPAVSGTFYPSSPAEITDMISGFLSRVQGAHVPPGAVIIGGIVPHAGYIYSGQTAAYFYSTLRNINAGKFMVIGPNHSSYPPEVSLYPGEEWITPLGRARVDRSLYGNIGSAAHVRAAFNEMAHSKEHSVEVQIPFLQYIYGNRLEFAPIVMGDQGADIARSLAQSILSSHDMPVIIASSDLTHYEPLEVANRKDHSVLDAVVSLDTKRFYRTLMDKMITACGYGPIAVLMEITRQLNGRMRLLHYSTSFEASGDPGSVVGYASLVAYTGGEE